MPTPVPEGLRFGALGQSTVQPKDAVAAFQRRGLLQPSFRWQDVRQEEHARSFAVAGVSQLDVLKLFQEQLDASIKTGGSLRDFSEAMFPRLVKAGYWGDVEVTDRDTGETRITRFDAARLELIFGVNTRQSYAAGRWARIEANKANKPFVMYRTMNDEAVRESHRPWHGLTLPVDHPFWQTHYPPNGWRCRCTAFAVSEKDIERYRKAGQPVRRTAPAVQTREFVNAGTGEIHVIPKGVDPGFAYNPGKASGSGPLTSSVRVLNERLHVADAAVAEAFVQQQIQGAEFDAFVREPSAGRVMPVAVLTDQAAEDLQAAVRVVNISGDTLIKQALRHPEIHPLDYLQVQRAIRQGEAIKDGVRSVIYLLEADGWVVVVKATRTGQGVFATSMRKLPSQDKGKDREINRLRKRAGGSA